MGLFGGGLELLGLLGFRIWRSKSFGFQAWGLEFAVSGVSGLKMRVLGFLTSPLIMTRPRLLVKHAPKFVNGGFRIYIRASGFEV